VKRTSPTLRVLADLARALWTQRRWWLLPVVFATLLVGAALLAGASPAAPFVYTFF
jgi:hypothetical protein